MLRNTLLIVAFAIAVSSCSTEPVRIQQKYVAPGVGETARTGLPELPGEEIAASPTRTASEANNYVCGSLFWRGAEFGVTPGDGPVTLDANSGGLAWTIYSWGGLGAGNIPEGIMLSITSLTGSFWLAISDYQRGAWSISGPYDVTTTSVPVSIGADAISTSGTLYAAVIVHGVSTLDLAWLNLVTSLESGRVYVDAGAPGPGDGSVGDPFPTVEAGVAAALDGDTVVLAPGEYNPPDVVYISRDIRVEGAGACRTRINEVFAVSEPPGVAPVVVEGLRCESVAFDSAFPAASELQVLNCVLDWGTGVSYSGGHTFLIQGCSITRGDLEDTAIGFTYGDATSINIVRDCTLTGRVRFAVGGGYSTNYVVGNTITGYVGDSSQLTLTYILDNVIYSGSISDTSGGLEGDDDLIVRGNSVFDGVVSFSGASVRFEDNYVDARSLSEEELGINECAAGFSSGTPTNITGNTVLLAKFPFDGSFIDGDDEAAAISTSAGDGVIEHNHLSGGTVGLISSSGAHSISHNTIEGAMFGIYGATWAQLERNIVRDCDEDGIILSTVENTSGGSVLIIQNNTVQNTGGPSLRFTGHSGDNPPDFGGGALGSLGGNVFSGYGEYALIMEETAIDLPVLSAHNNYWGVTTEAQIAAVIWDSADDVALTVVDFMPFLSEQP